MTPYFEAWKKTPAFFHVFFVWGVVSVPRSPLVFFGGTHPSKTLCQSFQASFLLMPPNLGSMLISNGSLTNGGWKTIWLPIGVNGSVTFR